MRKRILLPTAVAAFLLFLALFGPLSDSDSVPDASDTLTKQEFFIETKKF
jgi:hypothetical protein